MTTNFDGPEALKLRFWSHAKSQAILREQFDCAVFVFAKDRIENWIEFLTVGNTDESHEGPRVRHGREVSDAAKKLAKLCKDGNPVKNIPPSLEWSCKNWRTLVDRMNAS